MPQLLDTSAPCHELDLDSLFLQGVRGSIGAYTFKQIKGQTYYSKRVTTIKSKTPKQLRHRGRFVLARKFQKHILSNPYLKSQYQTIFDNSKTKYHRLCDYLIGAYLKYQLPILTLPLALPQGDSLYIPYYIEDISPKDDVSLPPSEAPPNIPFFYPLVA